MRHVVWDWNGTLLDDQHVVLGALNTVLAGAGRPPVDLATYRRLYTRPVRDFYERLLRRPIGDDEWAWLDDLYHRAYRRELGRARLTRDARHALEAVEREGLTQSLLSMYRHDDLLPLVDRFEVGGWFVRVDGLRGPGGGRKAGELEAHLAALADDPAPSEVLVVGDALDDAAAAAHVGARCVLYDGGSHPREELLGFTPRPAGDGACGPVAVASTLTGALAAAGLPIGPTSAAPSGGCG